MLSHELAVINTDVGLHFDFLRNLDRLQPQMNDNCQCNDCNVYLNCS